MADGIEWPRKTRELTEHRFDSTIWSDIECMNQHATLCRPT